jgi:hypothetical protein
MNSLQQGLIYNNTKEHNMMKLRKNNTCNLGNRELENVYEGMTNRDINEENEKLTNKLIDLERSYNEQLRIYKSNYNEYLDSYRKTGVRDENLWSRVFESNNKLKEISNEIIVESETINETNNPVYKNLEENREKIIKESKILDVDREKLLDLHTENRRLVAEYNEKMEDIKGKYYRYMAYTVGAVTLGTIAYYKVLSS